MDYFIINRKYIFKSGSIFQPAMLVYRSLYDIIISHLRSSSQNLDHQNPEDSRRCPGPRLSLATARFLQPAGHGCYDDFFGAPTSGASLCPKKNHWCPKSCSCVFFVFFFGLVFGLIMFFTRCLEKNNQEEESVKIIPANCSCSLGVFILMSQDGNLKEFVSSSSRLDSSYKLCRKSKPPNHKIQIHLQLRL